MQNENRRSEPPFYRQETPDSCVPACLRMVLAGLGVIISEADLCLLCDCTLLGTDAFQAVEAVRKLGLIRTSKYNLAMDGLSEVLADTIYPIVYLNLLPIDQEWGTHAMVVIAIDDATVTVLDPFPAVTASATDSLASAPPARSTATVTPSLPIQANRSALSPNRSARFPNPQAR
jgi:ABC-type bacteriocin/lantibiotic exporter with double-glycine peptidase domain